MPGDDIDPADFQGLYDAAACGLMVTSADGLIRQVNRTFCDWTGREPGELVGLATMQSLLTVGGRIFHQTHLNPLLQIQGSVSEIKLEVLHKDGRRLPTMWNARRRVQDGVVLHDLAIFIAEDRHKFELEILRARQRAEDLLRAEQEAQRLLLATQAERDRLRAVAEDRARFAEQMMAVVSHDLRNPLAVIGMSAALIQRNGTLSERQMRSLGQLNVSTQRAVRLISDLLDFSQTRLGSGLQVDFAEVDLQALVTAAVDDLRIAYPAAVLQHLGIGSGTFSASADRLMQLIGNLVSNAITYGTPGQPIIVTSIIEEQTVSIVVHNEGPPIPEQALPTLFDSMTRGFTRESAVHSLGLGLYIVRQIAQAHGGDVSVESIEGSGTTFSVALPRHPHHRAGKAGTPSDAEAREAARQEELTRLQISASRDSAYDDIVKLAVDTFDVPIALISLIDGDRQWFKARVGLELAETPREYSFCARAIEKPADVMMVEDASTEPRFAANPLVTGHPHIRFYAGAPLLTSSGHALGTLCVIDTQRRLLSSEQLGTLRFMARQVVTMMEQKVQGLPRRRPVDDSAGEPGPSHPT